jgi:hypothetical protein
MSKTDMNRPGKLWLSRGQRDVLIAHLDGTPVPIIFPASCSDSFAACEAQGRYQTTMALVTRGFLRTDNKLRSTHTMITEDGRNAIAAALADWADALVRANYAREAAIPEPELRWRPREAAFTP